MIQREGFFHNVVKGRREVSRNFTFATLAERRVKQPLEGLEDAGLNETRALGFRELDFVARWNHPSLSGRGDDYGRRARQRVDVGRSTRRCKS